MLLEISKEMMEIHRSLEQLLLGQGDNAIRAFGGAQGIGSLVPDDAVVGVGIGTTSQHSQGPNDLCVKVYVSPKLPKDWFADYFDRLSMDSGFPIEIEQVGRISAYMPTSRRRPVLGGCSIGHKDVSFGTMACILDSSVGPFVLSNNHVLANCNLAQIGDAIYQPGPGHGGTDPNNVIGTLFAFEPLRFESLAATPFNDVDLAIAKTDLFTANGCAPHIMGIGSLNGKVAPALNLPVKKMGCVTLNTSGTITDINLSVVVDYPGGKKAKFRNAFTVRSRVQGLPFSQPGDSGSLIVDEDNNACGLLFAGNNSITVANPIIPVLDVACKLAGCTVHLWGC